MEYHVLVNHQFTIDSNDWHEPVDHSGSYDASL